MERPLVPSWGRRGPLGTGTSLGTSLDALGAYNRRGVPGTCPWSPMGDSIGDRHTCIRTPRLTLKTIHCAIGSIQGK